MIITRKPAFVEIVRAGQMWRNSSRFACLSCKKMIRPGDLFEFRGRNSTTPRQRLEESISMSWTPQGFLMLLKHAAREMFLMGKEDNWFRSQDPSDFLSPNLYPIGSMYGNIYHQYTPNVSIYTIHGSYGYKTDSHRHLRTLQRLCVEVSQQGTDHGFSGHGQAPQSKECRAPQSYQGWGLCHLCHLYNVRWVMCCHFTLMYTL